MRILHVGNFGGNFGGRAKGAHLHSVAPKLSRGLIRLGHQVVDFADRDVARAGTPFGHRKLGVLAVNAALLRALRVLRPELLLLGHADTILAATVRRARREQPAMRVVQWNVDPIFDPANLRRLRSKLAVVDATLVSVAGEALAALRHPGMRLGFLPNPVDASVEDGRAFEHPALPHDLLFACGHPSRPKRMLAGQAWDMRVLLARLREAVPGLRLCLGGVACPHLLGAAYRSALAGSAIGLNASERNDLLLYSSDRLAQMAGSGLAVLVDRATGYDRLFAADAMAFFSDADELAAQLRVLVADPARRCAIGRAGHARYHALFNERVVAGYVLDVAFDRHDPTRYEWPTLLA